MDLSFRSRKRSRDEDEDFGIRLEGVPADKKQRNAAGLQLPPWLRENAEVRPSINRAHTLPFRLDHGISLPTQPPALFETIEDTDSSSGNSPASFASPEPADVEMNIDNQISIAGSASPPSPFTQTHPHLLHHRPDKLNSPGLDAFAGRIPTPIHSNFNLTQQQGPSSLGPSRTRTDSFLPAAAANMNALPRFAAPMKHKHLLEHTVDYSMPSPIAESPLIEEDDDDDLNMEMSDLPSSQLSRLSVSQDGMMDVDERMMWSQHSGMMQRSSSSLGPESAGGGLTFDVTPPTPTTPGRTGRARSGAFSASDGGGGEKGGRRVVFGFREDCEKCRMRVPGHFAHFV